METETRRAHERITDLEVLFQTHITNHDHLEKAVAANTVITQGIADNTAELVALVKGAKGIRSFVVWAAPLAAALIALWAWLKSQAAV